MTLGAIIVAAGSGSRAGGAAKQWRPLAGKPVARWSLETLLSSGCEEVVVVISAGAEADAARAFEGLSGWRSVQGGAERADSVRAGLAALAPQVDVVLIHDAARPFVTKAHVHKLEAVIAQSQGALPALPVADTLKRSADGRMVEATSPRAGLWRAQTPQAFRRAAIEDAYARWPGGEATDDAAVLEAAGGSVALVPGDPRLMKLTYPEDFPMAEALAQTADGGAPVMLARTGLGLDAHVFGPGDQVWLCGVSIPHTHGLVGHSDADAGLHALTDAVLGAMALGDIGDHFPPTDPQWKGAASDQFLIHAMKLIAAKGAKVINADVTLVCERPKVKPHREAMRARLAEILDLPVDRVSVKATTMEKMGFTGREEGLAAQAIVSVLAPA